MAHELDVNEATGALAMFSVKETPWHREGILLAEAPNLTEALRLGGMDFEVITRPVHVEQPEGGFSVSPYGRAIIRTDRNLVLGVAGGNYTPLQNHEAFGVLEPLLDSGVAHLETGGTLREGRDVWMLVRFEIKDPVVLEVFADEVVPFGLITNNHAGQAKVRLKNTTIRVVCANTHDAAMASGTEIAVLHDQNVRRNLVTAAETLWAGIITRYVKLAKMYRAMKATILTDEAFAALILDTAAPLPKAVFRPGSEHLTSAGYDHALNVANERRAALTEAWEHGVAHVGDRSAWEAYNGAIEVIDHDANLFRTVGSRISSMLGGRLAERKSLVLAAVERHVRAAGYLEDEA